MVNYILVLAIAIFCVLLLIIMEVVHLISLNKKPSKNKPRLVVPAPSKIKKPEKVPKTKPKEQKSFLQKMGLRSSEQEVTREAFRKRETEKHLGEEKVKDTKELKKSKLKDKIKELEAKHLKSDKGRDVKIDAMELARESTEFSELQRTESKAMEEESPEFYTAEGAVPERLVDKFNELLVNIYNDINTGMVAEAKNHYNQLLKIYNILVPKIDNKDELYAAVKEARTALMSVLQ